MRDDLPLLSSPSTRMCTSLSFFESAAVRRFNIAKYKKAQVKDTWMLPDAHPGLGGSEISGTLYCMRRQAPICVTFIHRDWSSAQDLASPPMPSQAEVTINNNKLEEHLLVWAASLGSEQRLARNPVLNYIYLVILGHGCVVFYHCHMSAANRA